MVIGAMSETLTLFPTRIHRAELDDPDLIDEIEATCQALALDDAAGRRWCKANRYPGYTSYASLDDLAWRLPAFKALARHLDREVRAFAKTLDFDLAGGKLALDSLWANVLPEGGHHAAHIHPLSVISGTFYVALPEGSAAIRFEDPRHAMQMASPPRKAKAAIENRAFVSLEPKRGTILLWESYLRHDVPPNPAEGDRISVSFNYDWQRRR